MSLDRGKLKKVRELGNGSCQAQCPACAEAGQDRKGEHLRISPEGKFGCCVFPGDREHRRRIFALAGDTNLVLARVPKAIRVKVAVATGGAVREVMLGGLAALSKPVGREATADGSDGAAAVQTEFEEIRTVRTGQMESVEAVA